MGAGSALLRAMAGLALMATCATAQTTRVFDTSPDRPRLTWNLYGAPGLIDMPTARGAPDGELALTVSHFGGLTRSTLTFQILPRLTGSFRYSHLERFSDRTSGNYDRSFDLRFRLLDEGRWGSWTPAVAVGLQDFIGTGLQTGEYVVATKAITPRFDASVGIGWGRLAGVGSFDNPLRVFGDSLADRPGRSAGDRGGNANFNRLFRGNAAIFGGASWQASERLTLLAEYSSDAYARAQADGLFERRSPISFGFDYQATRRMSVGGYVMHGDTAGLRFTYALNPARPDIAGGAEVGPPPLTPRPSARSQAFWTARATAERVLRDRVAEELETVDLKLEALSVGPNQATLRLRNPTYGNEAQAIGRAARAMARTLPAGVETFRIVPVVDGLPAATITLRRGDLEALENDPDGSFRMLARTRIDAAAPDEDPGTFADGLYPRFEWDVGPYLTASTFDPTNPLRLDFGLALDVAYHVVPGLLAEGRIQGRALGNRDDLVRGSGSGGLPRVRTLGPRYNDADVTMPHATLTHLSRPADDVYAKATAGYLEPMYGGLVGELLWKPANSRLALGVEVAYVKQRDFDQDLGFRDYDVVTGHASAYYRFANGFKGQLDVGRYLAGDVGATLRVDRTFANGWSVGAYATKTDVSSEEFGEGSFDKGILIEIPISWFGGQPERSRRGIRIQPIQRDGGARLFVRDRLEGLVEGYDRVDLDRRWGKFWR
ncbi:YjbH domain-containing protein [Jannaschia sp. LMIT008]|uniref:YjbH domain-containing protein n=1 Tax=Jannaschia maritima TaxID=3032585 RepID=UPI002812362F|nr:YjbH domain-containing protein [Jannaschia sp. LMIT008]